MQFNRPKSEEVYARACQSIPGGASSPVRSFSQLPISPLIAASGRGEHIWDADAKEYIDYCCGWGSLILGHSHPSLLQAASTQLEEGICFGLTTEVEQLLASKVISLVPSIEKIRFVSSGTEATMTAIRLARAYTGRSKVVKFIGHYHGHADPFLVAAGSGVFSLNASASSKGVPIGAIQDTICVPWNDFEQVRSMMNKMGEQIAAVILEPIAANMGLVPPLPGFLSFLREQTQSCGALLIFDEVITGFRVGLEGAQGKYGIFPDLTCFGKIIGGGFPAAAVGGRSDIMDLLAPLGEVYQAGTLSGSPLAMRVGLRVLEHLEVPNFYSDLSLKAKRLLDPIEEVLQKTNAFACLQHAGSLVTLFFGARRVCNASDLQELDQEMFSQFFCYLFKRGIYIPPLQQESWFISNAHSDKSLDYTAECIVEFFETLSR